MTTFDAICLIVAFSVGILGAVTLRYHFWAGLAAMTSATVLLIVTIATWGG